MPERETSSATTDGEIVLRRADRADVDALVRLSTGPIAGKGAFIIESLTRRSIVAACLGDRVVGYVVWDRTFFGRPFVWLLGVDAGERRRGIGASLMRAFEAACPGESLFTSTNESNRPMQALLARLEFVLSGRIDNLDPEDPELFFYKGSEAQAASK